MLYLALVVAFGTLVWAWVAYRRLDIVCRAQEASQRRLWLAHGRLCSRFEKRVLGAVPAKTAVWPGRLPSPEPVDWADDFQQTDVWAGRDNDSAVD